MLTHANTGNRIPLDDPKAVKALERAKAVFENEENMRKINKYKMSFKTARWQEEGKTLLVEKTIIFEEAPQVNHEVTLTYTVLDVTEDAKGNKKYKLKRVEEGEIWSKQRKMLLKLGNNDTAYFFDKKDDEPEWTE